MLQTLQPESKPTKVDGCKAKAKHFTFMTIFESYVRPRPRQKKVTKGTSTVYTQGIDSNSNRVHPVNLANVARSARWPATFGPSRSAWASDPPKLAAVVLHSASPFITTQPESWYSVYRPTESRRLSRPGWQVWYWDGLPARRQSPIQVLTGLTMLQ